MGVPERVADAQITRFAREIHLHQAHPRFDQPPGKQDTLAEFVSAVFIAARGPARDSDRTPPRWFPESARRCPLCDRIVLTPGAATLRRGKGPFNLIQQRTPQLEPCEIDILRQAQAVDSSSGRSRIASQ